jgi:hypothetical protein
VGLSELVDKVAVVILSQIQLVTLDRPTQVVAVQVEISQQTQDLMAVRELLY